MTNKIIAYLDFMSKRNLLTFETDGIEILINNNITVRDKVIKFIHGEGDKFGIQPAFSFHARNEQETLFYLYNMSPENKNYEWGVNQWQLFGVCDCETPGKVNKKGTCMDCKGLV